MPPSFRPGLGTPENNKVNKIDTLIEKKLLPHLKGVSVAEARATLEKYTNHSDIIVNPDKIINDIIRRCPKGLDRIEFEVWVSKNIGSLAEEGEGEYNNRVRGEDGRFNDDL